MADGRAIRRMRVVTPEEAEEWRALARQYGFVNEQGDFALGRFVFEKFGLERVGAGRVYVRFITPVPAGLYTEDLQRKGPPILFDRTAEGQIIIPGRWWQSSFERFGEDPAVPADVRRQAARIAHHGRFSDAVLPADVETIAILVPDEKGEPVPHEALPPGTRAVILVEGVPDQPE
ncbi:MAG: hypothetical protein HYT86_00070 [candidate division NC10 bacterium]|nr:hypothetical protein [candidate division NC10 bacterium]